VWWRDAVGYEVYIRSFADGDGDGVGDLIGLHRRLDHLAWLGVDIVWITPFYPSPMADFGYDVSDYCGVDPVFGTLDDFDRVVERAQELGLRVMVDLVPNHTSDQHPWFVDARSGRDAGHRDWYVWRDPAPGGGPPNNWVSHFGGPAWTLDEATGQYYMHLFLPEQPDLNWANPAVADAFDDVMRFWLDRGVAGFRIDVAHSLVEDPDYRDNPVLRPLTDDMSPRQAFASFDHSYDLDQAAVFAIYRRWNRLVHPYDAALLGEVYLTDAGRVGRYVEPGRLHLAFYFKAMHIGWEYSALAALLRDGYEAAGGGVAWVQSSHDDPRPATRFGGDDAGRERALVLSTLYAGLPGMVFLYQGEELGLTDGAVPPEQSADPAGTRNINPADSRDGCRTPMPWAPVDGFGFTDAGVEPWLPFGGRSATDTVEVQSAEPASWLHRYRRLLEVRRRLGVSGPVEWLPSDEASALLGYRRGSTMVVANVSDQPVHFDPPAGSWEVTYLTNVAEDQLLAPRSAAIMSERR